jgi:hypothetical protein
MFGMKFRRSEGRFAESFMMGGRTRKNNGNGKDKMRGLSTAAAKCAASGRDDGILWGVE